MNPVRQPNASRYRPINPDREPSIREQEEPPDPELERLYERRAVILKKNLPPHSIEVSVILPRIEGDIARRLEQQ